MIPFLHDLDACLEVLEKGGLILYPTDTIWGIGCDATNEAAVDRIYRLKQRPDSKAMVVLVADEKEILQYTAAVDLAVFDYLEQRSKPTTVIYEQAIGIADNLLASDGSVAIRICRDEFCRHLLKRFQKPIVSTSANFSGQPAPQHFGEIDPLLKEGLDYVVNHRQQERQPASPSSIIRWHNGSVEVIRD